MKRSFWIIGILFVLLLCGAVYYLPQHWEFLFPPAVHPQPEVKQASIYIDTSSYATLLQMVDVVRQQDTNPKFIFWQRLRHLNPKDPLLQNATLFFNDPTKKSKTFLKRLQLHLKHFVDTYPNASFIVHLNKNHNAVVWAVLRNIPKERIVQLHFYEESFASSAFSMGGPIVDRSHAIELLNQTKTPGFFGIDYASSLMQVYPSIFHIGYPQYTMTIPYKKRILERLPRLEPVDFTQIAKELTPQQKKDLLRLANIQEKDMAPFQQGKPVILYTLGYFSEARKNNEQQIALFEKVYTGQTPYVSNPQEYVWVYKEHPWPSHSRFIADTMADKFPSVYALPKEFPLEILFLTGYMPDKVFGYSSSLFFALPKEHVLFFIQRINDPYLPILYDMGILTKQQVVSYEDFGLSR